MSSGADKVYKVLLVEDIPTDAELAQREIKKVLKCEFLCVDTRDDFLKAIEEFKPDIIISDYQMPAFDGLTALKLAMELLPDTPVIILTAATNEDTAVGCMKAGAKDYVIKEHIKRLGQAVLHALEEKQKARERKDFEAALRKTEQRLHELAENLSSALFVVEVKDDIGSIVYLSPGFESIWAGERQSFQDNLQSWIERIHPDDKGFLVSLIDDFKQRKIKSINIQYRIIDKNNEVRWVRTKANSIFDNEEGILRVFGVSDDITERKNAEDEKRLLEMQLSQAQKLESVGRLAGGVAHDFNNMLSVIIGYTEIMKSELHESSPFMDNLIEIETAAQRSRHIAQQLLAFSRKQLVSPKIINLNDMLIAMQKTLLPLIGEDIELEFTLEHDLWNINFDSSQAEQILINLVVNARDAMPGGGKLELKTQNVVIDDKLHRDNREMGPGEFVKFSVTDSGTGMDEETMSHIFEPFFTTKDIGRGTGLGLSTVYGTVTQNGGFIQVQSKKGRGSIFDIYIPRCKEKNNGVAKGTEQPVQHSQGTILLVEDEELLRKMIAEMLKALGHKVIVSQGPLDALNICKHSADHIDLLLTDVVMPEMNGNELRKHIEARLPGIKTLFISGYTADVIINQGVPMEGTEFLQKPFNINDLSKKIKSVLHK